MSLRGSLEKNLEALSLIADDLDTLGSQIRGIHAALGEQHSETTAGQEEIKLMLREIRGEIRGIKTAAMAWADVSARVRVIEDALNAHADNGNGSA